MMAASYQYIKLEPEPIPPGRKTATWKVINKRWGSFLGMVAYYAPWRQFCFYPAPECVFSAGCMADISDFIGRAMASRKESQARERAYARGDQGAGIMRFDVSNPIGDHDDAPD